jgi:nitrilase
MNERSPDSKTSLYNSLVTILPDGSIANVHRKLVPTMVERNVWAPGDAAGLRVIETEFGRIGALICWENLMPLARFSLYAQGIEVYIVSTYDSGDVSVATMQHIAREGNCWVVCSGVALRLGDVPTDMPGYEALYGTFKERNPDAEWINEGDSLIVNPRGEIVEGPLRNEYGFLYGEIDTSAVRRNRWCLDAAGHYNRPDIFDLTVNRRRLSPIEFDDAEVTHEDSGVQTRRIWPDRTPELIR